MSTRSKSTLFLIEQLIVIAVFAISAAACITILTSAYFTSVESRDTKNAILVAENVAETFKATNGSPDSITKVLGGESSNVTINNNNYIQTTIYYNNNWQVTNEENASYTLFLTQEIQTPGSSQSLIKGNIIVNKVMGDEILSFPVAVTVPGRGGEADE